jgi:hypothetical protein
MVYASLFGTELLATYRIQKASFILSDKILISTRVLEVRRGEWFEFIKRIKISWAAG